MALPFIAVEGENKYLREFDRAACRAPTSLRQDLGDPMSSHEFRSVTSVARCSKYDGRKPATFNWSSMTRAVGKSCLIGSRTCSERSRCVTQGARTAHPD